MTKDPITVLRDEKALNDAAWKFIESAPRDGIPTVLWNNLKATLWPAIQCYVSSTAPAAIQPAGDIPMGYVNLETLDCAISFYQNKIPEGYLPFYLAPVSAPVPEAKAEQSLQALADQAQKLGLYAAPAVKHEASKKLDPSEVQTIRERLTNAHPRSAPIAAKGSIGDDAEFQHRMGDFISALDEDREDGTDAAYDRARSKFISYVNRWADARSPVAAPDSARDADGTDLAEGIEILDSLISSIEQHGNYSKDATLTFLGQLSQCLATAASSGEKGEA